MIRIGKCGNSLQNFYMVNLLLLSQLTWLANCIWNVTYRLRVVPIILKKCKFIRFSAVIDSVIAEFYVEG